MCDFRALPFSLYSGCLSCLLFPPPPLPRKPPLTPIRVRFLSVCRSVGLWRGHQLAAPSPHAGVVWGRGGVSGEGGCN